MHSRRLILKHTLISAAFVLFYLLLNRPEIIFFSRIGSVAWYPATGLVLALMLGVSPRYAFLTCFADALTGGLIYRQSHISYSNTLGAVGLAACYGTVAYLLRGVVRINLELRHRRDVVLYVLVSGAGAIGATIIGVGCLLADHSISWGEYKSAASGWFLGDSIGLVGIAPFLLVHVFPHVRKWLSGPSSQLRTAAQGSPEPVFNPGSLIEACAQILTMVLVLWVMFGSAGYDHFYLSFVPIIWIAMRQGVRRVVSGLLVINFGVVVAMHAFPPTAALFTKVALLMLVLSTVGLIVGSEVSERQRLSSDLNEQSAYLDSLIQNCPLGIVVVDERCAVKLANPAFERLLGYSHGELTRMGIAGTGPSGQEPGVIAAMVPQILAGNTLSRTIQQRRKDGGVVDLALRGVPLLVDGKVQGAYLIYEDVSEQIKASEAQRQHAESLDKLVKELELHAREMTFLNEMGALLECSGTVEEACSIVANSMQRLFPAAGSGALYLFKSSRNLLELMVRWGNTGVSEATFVPEACWSLRRGQPYWNEHPSTGITCKHLQLRTVANSICVPMVAHGNTVGMLHFEFENLALTESGRSSIQQLAITTASQIALSLANLQLRESLREQSIRDPLTYLFNRRFLEESLERELQVAARKRHAVAILFLDLDHFKKFNDVFGHDAGDVVLKSLADLLRNFFRSTDICCRYGGEEFAIILPEAPAREAAIRADALRSEVKQLRLQYKKQPLGQLSISVGVAAFPEHGTTSEQVLKVADQCLYESKKRGRDVVTVPSGQPAPAPPLSLQ
jgi:diguanylate cyclase (GGDEF)-like protein/PAS domain S-box-containing protein